MEEALGMARAKDTKERMTGVERLYQHLESSRRELSPAEGALQALSTAAVISGEHLKLHLNGLVPAAVERLGDGKQPVRDAAGQLLITLMEFWFQDLPNRSGTAETSHETVSIWDHIKKTGDSVVDRYIEKYIETSSIEPLFHVCIGGMIFSYLVALPEERHHLEQLQQLAGGGRGGHH